MRFNPLNNLTLKIGAVLLALLLWVHVATNKTYEHQIDLQLKVVNVPTGLALVSDVPPIVTVRVKTTGKQLIALSTRQHSLAIDASEYREGSFERDLTDRDAATAFDQAYEQVGIVFPRKLFFRFERETAKNLLVEPKIRAVAGPGFIIVGDPKVEPEMVTVTGPNSSVRGLKAIETLPVELNGLTTSTSHKVELLLPDSLHLTLGDSAVTVSFTIEPMVERTLSDIAVKAPRDFNNSRYSFSPATIAVRLGFPASLRDSLDFRQVRASFSLGDDYRDSVRAAIRYTLPANVTVIGNSLDSVLILQRL
ncbi:MAG: CdaR family protein [Candidatus Zixiibacteriota bacterium]